VVIASFRDGRHTTRNQHQEELGAGAGNPDNAGPLNAEFPADSVPLKAWLR
jgi:hypothetical protein